MTLRIGSLFSGYGGLDLAIQQVYDAEHAWFCEFDDAPSKILAHHWPDVPNHRDVITIDWSNVEPIHILTGGFPCQDVSVAGRRAGMRDGTRSGLWAEMRNAIDQLRPGLVVIENVGGLFSAEANRIVEPCDYHLGDADGGGHTVLLRAADAVLGDLATLGYGAEWTTLRAADVGAPHGRLRVFITAHPRRGGGGRWPERPESSGCNDATVGSDPRGDRGRDHQDLTLLPTPSAALSMMGGGRDPEERRSGNHSITLKDAIEGGPGLPRPEFGPYAPAIARWEHVLGRPAPDPTEPGRTRPRLASRFVEFLMGLPDGHVTATPGLTRNQQLKALGNGVVPQQGAAALRHLHNVRSAHVL